MNHKIHLIHHWLVGLRGGEKVLEQFCELFPNAPIHTLVTTRNTEALGTIIPQHKVIPSFLNYLPASEKLYQKLLPVYPLLIGNHKVEADFILSSDASLIKGMKKEEHVPHVCYCHSPPRYLWDMQEDYLNSMDSVTAKVFELFTPYLRKFDLEGANNVDDFIANSAFVKKRIKRIYGKESEVIHPPVALHDFEYSEESEEFYLMVSALVPYKRVDLAVDAFNRLGKRLIIIGDGPELNNLRNKAKENISIMGLKPFSVLKDHYSRCKAFIFPGVEDFGITPLEAQASGKPVIAYKEGGALETVIENETGLFFQEQTIEALVDAIERFENESFSPQVCRNNAEKFSPESFRKEIISFLNNRYSSHFEIYDWNN